MDVNPEALAAALEFLRIRDRSRAEVESKLSKLGYFEADIEAVLDHLIRRRMVDDERLAANTVAQTKGMGPKRIQARLENIGIDASTSVSLISEDDQLRAMRELIHKRRFGPADRGKAARFLAGRGFEEDLIRQAIEAEWGDGDEFVD